MNTAVSVLLLNPGVHITSVYVFFTYSNHPVVFEYTPYSDVYSFLPCEILQTFCSPGYFPSIFVREYPDFCINMTLKHHPTFFCKRARSRKEDQTNKWHENIELDC